MITSIKPHAPVLPSDEADAVLPGLKFSFASGNACVITPSVKKLDGGGSRTNITFAWRYIPTGREQFEAEAEVNRIMGREPDFITEPQSVGECEEVQDAWLGRGEVPGNARRKQ
jgi:hypothetical protein